MAPREFARNSENIGSRSGLVQTLPLPMCSTIDYCYRDGPCASQNVKARKKWSLGADLWESNANLLGFFLFRASSCESRASARAVGRWPVAALRSTRNNRNNREGNLPETHRSHGLKVEDG